MYKYRSEIVLVGSIILISIISFNFGRLEATRGFKKAISIYEREGELAEIDFKVYASVNSNKYHFPWCSGAKLISPKNRIEFENEDQAVSAGYILAKNCSQ